MSSEELPECLSIRNKALHDLVTDALSCVTKTSSSSNNPKPTTDRSCCKLPVMGLAAEVKSNSNSTYQLEGQDDFSSNGGEMTTVMNDFWRNIKDDRRSRLPLGVHSKLCVQNCTGSSNSRKDKPKCSKSLSREGSSARVKCVTIPIVQSPRRQQADCVGANSNLPFCTARLRDGSSVEDLPECLNNRNKVLNELLRDALACVQRCESSSEKPEGVPSIGDGSCCKEPVTIPAVERTGCNDSSCPIQSLKGYSCKDDEMSTIMCDYWRNMKDDTRSKRRQLNQSQCVQNCTGSSCSGGKENKPSKKCSKSSSREGLSRKDKRIIVPIVRSPKNHDCGVTARANIPLRKAMFNMEDAASIGESCAERVRDLLSVQQTLIERIQNLEEKEKKGVVLLQEADKMWSSMEQQYKKELNDKKETYKMLQKEQKALEGSLNKWRKSQKDLDFEIKTLDSNSQEIKTKTMQKEHDIKVLQLEIESYKKRIATNTKDLEVVKNSYKSKKEASEARLAKIDEGLQNLQRKVIDECNCKEDKEHEGSGYIKEAREDLQKLCGCLLQKKLENEDLRAEKRALLQEISLLKTTYDTCSERCARREKNIVEETKRVDNEILDCETKCVQCHRQTDSAELTGYCIDCPRCKTKRDCLIKGDECFADHNKDCICTQVKEKFLNNVFENMYNVLEKKAKTCPGQEVADCIFTCLERSTNGKLDADTRKVVQDFVLTTVKNNLNLTIVGGAVKTRCEMDSETYEQLMLCLKDVAINKPNKPDKTDKSTVPRKPPCTRWNVSSECNCPKGPKDCPCNKNAPKTQYEPGTCVPEGECTEVPETTLKLQPCEEGSCSFGVNMRAAQCVMGPEVLSKVRSFTKRQTPTKVSSATVTNKRTARCSGNKAVKSCHTDTEHLIADVDSNFTKVTLMDKQVITKEQIQQTSAKSQTPSGPRSIVAAPLLVNLELEDMIKNLNQNNSQETYKIFSKYVNDQFSELKRTPSGKIASYLDEQKFKLRIASNHHKDKQRIKQDIHDSQLFLSIKATSSKDNFDVEKTIIVNSHVKLTRSETRTIVLDKMHKNIISKDALSNKKPNAPSSSKISKFRHTSEECIESGTPIYPKKQTIISDKNLIGKDEIYPIFTKTAMPLKKEEAVKCLWSKSNFQGIMPQNHSPVSSTVLQDAEQFITKTCDIKSSSDSFVFKTLLDNLHSDSSTTNLKELPMKSSDTGKINNYFTDKQEVKTLAVVDEKGTKDVTERPTNNEVSCSAVSLRSESIPQLIDSVHKVVATTRPAESDDCCKPTRICARLLLNTMNRLPKKPNSISSRSIKIRVKSENKQTIISDKNVVHKDEIDRKFSKTLMPLEHKNELKCLGSTTTSQGRAQTNSNSTADSGAEFHDAEQFITKIGDKKASYYSLPLNFKLSAVKNILNHLQSDTLKNLSMKRLSTGEVMLSFPDKKVEKVSVYEEVRKDVNESITKIEVSCSAVTMQTVHIPQSFECVHNALATMSQAKSDDYCKGPSISVSARLLFDSDDMLEDTLAQQSCPYKSKDFTVDNYNAKRIGGVSSQLKTKIKQPAGQIESQDGLNYLPLQLPDFLKENDL